MRYLLLCLLLTSCSHSLTINPKGCYSSGLVGELKGKGKKIESTVASFGDNSEEYLIKLLADNKVDCKRIKTLNYSFRQGPLDSLVSIIPFLTMKTIVINYTSE